MDEKVYFTICSVYSFVIVAMETLRKCAVQTHSNHQHYEDVCVTVEQTQLLQHSKRDSLSWGKCSPLSSAVLWAEKAFVTTAA